ncbi:MAG: hypothetical protein RLO04_10875 [Limnobacter sp.]|uniref:hypothetical protein n=1 Tax=Limnobacter sp. TaxID=2003368 RepID=UPI0032EC0B7F
MEMLTIPVNDPATSFPVSNFIDQEAKRLKAELQAQQSKLASLMRRYHALEEEQQRRNSFLSQNALYCDHPPLIADSKEDFQIWKKCRGFSSQTKAIGELLDISLAQCEQTRKMITDTLADLAWFQKTHPLARHSETPTNQT